MDTYKLFKSYLATAKLKLSIFDLEDKTKLEDSLQVVKFTANQITTTSRNQRLVILLLGCVIFSLVFSGLFLIFKPVSEISSLKITKENFIKLEESPSNDNIEFKMTIPTAVKWLNNYYFFDKKEADGSIKVELPRKDGVHKFYFYAYQPSWFNKNISEKPVLITKEFDFSTPKVENVKLESKYKALSSNWTFESDEENPIIKMKINDKETLLYNPLSTFQDNKCKQEKSNGNIKYTCPINFEKEGVVNVSATIEDKVGNIAVVLEKSETAYVEPLKATCSQPPYKTRQESVIIKCKTNRDTKYSLNNSVKEEIKKDVEKNVPLQIGLAQSNDQEYQFVLNFEDPNGTPIELSYKVLKDSSPPRVEFDPKTDKNGSIYIVSNNFKNASEAAKVDLSFDQSSSPNPSFYYKYPDNRSFDISPSSSNPIQFYSSEFKFCVKDPITNTETCIGAFTPSIVSYSLKFTDDVGNQSSFQCTHELNGTNGAKCSQY